MLEFMNERSVNFCYLSARFQDCEPNMLSFNFITTMAICLEVMLKLAFLEYAEDKQLRVGIYDLEENKKRDGDTYTLGTIIRNDTFVTWLERKYGISQKLVENLKALNTENNHFKHSLQKIKKKGPIEKKAFFKPFYEFSAKYYEHRTGRNAPPWQEEEYNKLMNTEYKRVYRRSEIILSVGGKAHEHSI